MALSYASTEMRKPHYLFIRAVESISGGRFFDRAYQRLQQLPKESFNFWNYVVMSLGNEIDAEYMSVDAVPAHGPLVIVANHPYGIVDGASIASMVTAVRDDLRIIIWDVVSIPDEFQRFFLPLNLSNSRFRTLKQNVAVRREAIKHLRNGGSILIFPAGAAEYCEKPWSRPLEAPWTRFAAKLVHGSGARILPVYVHGHNSRLFHALSHLGYTVRTSLFVYETRRKRGDRISLTVGRLIEHDEFCKQGDERQAIDWLRQLTLSLNTGCR